MKQTEKPSIGIIGCGWLGSALAKVLIKNTYPVMATVRNPEKQQTLMAQNIACQLMSVPEQVNKSHPIFSQQILIIAITPGFKRGLNNYHQNVQAIVNTAEAAGVKKIILTSSTGAYLGMAGEVYEHTVLAPSSEKARMLYEAEQAVLNSSLEGKVLRLSGLVGDDRLPGKFLAGKTNLTGGNAGVNLIHQTDVVGLLFALIEQATAEQVFVGVSNTQVDKSTFYQQAAKSLHLTPPQFDDNAPSKTHKVLGEKTRSWLNYHYQYDDLFAWLSTLN